MYQLKLGLHIHTSLLLSRLMVQVCPTWKNWKAMGKLVLYIVWFCVCLALSLTPVLFFEEKVYMTIIAQSKIISDSIWSLFSSVVTCPCWDHWKTITWELALFLHMLVRELCKKLFHVYCISKGTKSRARLLQFNVVDFNYLFVSLDTKPAHCITAITNYNCLIISRTAIIPVFKC